LRGYYIIAPLIFLSACSPPERPSAAGGESVVKDLVVSESVLGRPDWLLKAKTATIKEKEKRMLFTSPELVMYNESASTASVITADTGELETEKKAGELSGAVQVNSAEEGMILTTDKLYYSSKKGKIWTDEPIIVHKDKAVITGKGFTSNLDLTEIEINKQETRMEE